MTYFGRKLPTSPSLQSFYQRSTEQKKAFSLITNITNMRHSLLKITMHDDPDSLTIFSNDCSKK